MTVSYIYFIIFACFAYLIVTDRSIAHALYLLVRIARRKLQVFKWWILHDPATPWTRFIMWRRSLHLAKELMNEIQSKNK